MTRILYAYTVSPLLYIELPCVPSTELAAEICTMAGHINAANYRFLKLIAEFDRRSGWADNVTQSCAHWLNWKCGIDMGAAREWVRVAHAIEKLPKVSAAMERRRVELLKVRAMTRVACEHTEETFLMFALHGTAQHTEKFARLYRRGEGRGGADTRSQPATGKSVFQLSLGRRWFARLQRISASRGGRAD